MFATRQPLWTPEKSAARLHLLQTFVPGRTLFIPGPDGAVQGEEDPSSQAVARYLFQGDYGTQLLNTVIDDEALEDMFLCLGNDQVEIYRPPSFVTGCGALMARWNNVTQMKPPRAMVGDSYQCEEFKIRAFLKTVQGRDALNFTESAETIERWPLVQAHALEEFHMGGFLTQKHQVTNVVAKVAKALAYVDAHTVDCVLAKNVEMLRFHWKTMMLTLDKPKTPWRRLELSETDIVEPLASFYDFGKIQDNSSSSSSDESKSSTSSTSFRGARVLLGGRTGDSDTVSHNFAQIGNTGAEGRPAVHFTVEGDDSVSGVRCARTYLLTSIDNAILPATAEEDDEDDEADDAAEEDTLPPTESTVADMSEEDRAMHFNAVDRKYASSLMQLYGHMKRGMDQMRRASSLSSTDMASATSCQSFLTNMIGKDLNNVHAKSTDRLTVEVSDFDAHGKSNNVGARRFRYVKIVLVLDDKCGALVLGDTWSVVVKSSLHTTMTKSDTFCMTSEIPYIRSWVCSRQEGDAMVELKRQVARSSMESLLGNMYHDSELRRATLLFGDAVNTDTFLPLLLNCNVRFYHGGIYFHHNGEGAVCYMFGTDVFKIRLVESDTGGMSLLALTLAPTAPILGAVNHYVANRNQNGEREIGLLLPRGSGLLEAAKDAYRRWTRSTDGVNTHDDQSQGITDSPVAAGLIECRRLSADTNAREGYGLLKQCYLHALPGTWDTDCVHYVNKCLEMDVHLTAATGTDSNAETKTTTTSAAAGTEAWATQQSNSSSIPLILVAGTPGSGKMNFSTVLTDRTRDEFTWKLVETTALAGSGAATRGTAMALDVRCMVSSLATIAGSGSPSSTTSPLRALLVIPGAYTIADVIHAIGSNTAVANQFHVTATVGCVNVPISSRHSSATEHDVQLIPGVVEQVRRGWTTHMMVFGADRSSATPSSNVAVRNHLMQVNPDANMVLASGMRLTQHHQLPSATSTAASPGSTATSTQAASALPGCSVLGDVLITRDQLLAIATENLFASELFVNGRRFQTVSATTSAVWQSISTSMNGYLFRDRYVAALSALTTPLAASNSVHTVAEDPPHPTSVATSTSNNKKGGFMARLQEKAKAKVLGGGIDANKGGFAAVQMPLSTVDTETWYVESTVCFCEYPERWFKCCAAQGHVWCVDVTDSFALTSSVQPMTFLCVGPQVDTFLTSGQQTNYKTSVVAMLSSCAPPLPTKKSQRTRRMLQANEIEQVDLAHREMNAGDGWYFDGRTYVGPTGDSRRQHPKLETFLNEYLKEQNDSIEMYNNQVQARRTRSELSRQGERYEDVQDVSMYVEEEIQRVSGVVGAVVKSVRGLSFEESKEDLAVNTKK